MNSLCKPFARFSLVVLIFILAGCGSTAPTPIEQISEAESTAEFIDELLATARRRSGPEAASLYITAIEAMLQAQLLGRAAGEVDSIDPADSLPPELKLRYALIRGDIALQQQQAEEALRWLTGSLVVAATAQSQFSARYYQLLATAYRDSEQFADAVSAYIQLLESEPAVDASSGMLNPVDEIWNALAQISDSELDEFASSADSYELRGWIELARIIRVDQFSIKRQLNSIAQWQRIWARHSAASKLPIPLLDLQQIWDERPKHIALILPLQEAAGNAIQEGFLSAYYQALAISRDVPRISVYDSSGLSTVHQVYNQAVASGAELIIGPLNKRLVNQLRELAELPVPTLALNYADDAESAPGRLYQFGLAPEDDIEQAAELAWQLGYRNAAIVTPASDNLRLQSIFSDKWIAKGGTLVSQATFIGDTDYVEVIKSLMAIDSSEARADRLLDLLPRSEIEFTPRRREDIDFIFLNANPRQGRQIKPTLAFYFAENIPVFAMPSIYDGMDNQSENRDLDGIIFADAPWVLGAEDPLKSEISNNLRQTQGPLQRLRAMGIDCFRLYPRLSQMADRQLDRLTGTTGILTMTANQRIHRSPEIARFVDGLAEILEIPDSADDSDIDS